MRSYLLVGLLVFGLVACSPQATPTPMPPVINPNANMANPASTHCVEKGGEVQIRTDADGGEIGFCVFPDGSACEEWAFFRGECQPGGGSGTESDPYNTVQVRERVLTHLSQSAGDALGALPAEWTVENTTPAGLLGVVRLEHRGGNLVVVISYPVVPPDQVTYTVEVIRSDTNTRWSFEVSADGLITPSEPTP